MKIMKATTINIMNNEWELKQLRVSSIHVNTFLYWTVCQRYYSVCVRVCARAREKNKQEREIKNGKLVW